MRLYRKKGQDFQTTNWQRQTSLAQHGRPRGRRTVQRTRARRQRMGLVRYEHVRRAGATRGRRDSLRCFVLSGFDTPPAAAGAAALRADAAPASTTKTAASAAYSGRERRSSAGTAGRDGPPAVPAGHSSEEDGEAPSALELRGAQLYLLTLSPETRQGILGQCPELVATSGSATSETRPITGRSKPSGSAAHAAPSRDRPQSEARTHAHAPSTPEE